MLEGHAHNDPMRDFDASRVGERLRRLRQANGLSQGQIAKRVGGFTASAYANWEQGLSRPGIEPLVRICDHFDLTLDYLLLGRAHTLRFDVRAKLGLA